MQFTYKAYLTLVSRLRFHGYVITDYHCWHKEQRCVILRHDIDYDINQALKMAEIEAENGIKSTYFVMITSDFYNIHSMDTRIKIKRIVELGHEIGVHYDELAYPEAVGKIDAIVKRIEYEKELLQGDIGTDITVVSMHRPSKGILEGDITIPGMINSYGKTFFYDFKYVSDSRRKWRESVEKYIETEEYERIHILTHPFWYFDIERDIHKTLFDFIERSKLERWDSLSMNFRDLSSIISKDEI